MSVLCFPAEQMTCPALGGPDLTTLFVTSAAPATEARTPTQGQAEHRVFL
ncbi:SMP-30/gluconolactonase/LRE family protein [Antarctobacter sp.]|nr:SMP-30/gluconolactonase/LRE family protein [Antarctobacter sp.]